MTNIQEARDVLDKWRDQSTPAPWVLRWVIGDPEWPVVIAEGYGAVIDTVRGGHKPADARLIVGTAGNPELLDAIDLQLRLAIRNPNEVYDETVMRVHEALAHPLAAAIIAADERMNA